MKSQEQWILEQLQQGKRVTPTDALSSYFWSIKMIDWMQFAKMNNLSPAQFEKEILTVAAVIGAMAIDERAKGGEDALEFTCSDSKGKIAVVIRRLNE